MARSPRSLRIVWPALLAVAVSCRSQSTHPRTPAGTETRTIALRHAAAEEVALAVGRGAGEPDLRVLVDARTNSLILSGTPQAVAAAEGVLEELDRPPR